MRGFDTISAQILFCKPTFGNRNCSKTKPYQMTKQEEFQSEDVDIKRENLLYSKFDTLHEVVIYNFLAIKAKVYKNIIIQVNISSLLL